MSEVAEKYLETLKEKIVYAAIDYRFWFTYFCNSVEQNKVTSDSADKLKWQRDIEESENYVKNTRKSLFDLIEKYNAETKAMGLSPGVEPQGGT